MQTLKPILKVGPDVWDKISMPETEFIQRIERVRSLMRDLNVLLIYSKGPDEYGDTCYLSNLLTREAMVIVPAKGEVVAVVPGSARELPGVKETTWLTNIIPGEIFNETIKFLGEKGLLTGNVGLAGTRLMPDTRYRELNNHLQLCKVANADNIIKDLRLKKSPREIDQIRRSARIGHRIFEFIAATKFSILNESVIGALIHRVANLEGVEDCRVLVGRPQVNDWALRPEEASRLSTGERIIIYLALEYQRYWSEHLLTFAVGSGNLMVDDTGAIEKIYASVVGSIKPGKTCSALYRDIMQQFNNSGLESILDYGLGQGIGLSLEEFPVISPRDNSKLHSGMCLSLRLAVKHPKAGFQMIGKTLYVSEDGAETLT